MVFKVMSEFVDGYEKLAKIGLVFLFLGLHV
jgi:hypothetical protein